MVKIEECQDHIERLSVKLYRYELSVVKLYSKLCGSYDNYTHEDYERYGDDITRLTQNYLRYMHEHPELTKGKENNDKPSEPSEPSQPSDETNE
jgi:hypothetical protein